MHHVFEVDEILRTIAFNVMYQLGGPDAVSFACCCKSFSAPALDALWGMGYYDFTHLLRTLPQTTWTVVGGAFVGSTSL